MTTAKHLRDRAKDCLNLAKGARGQADRIMLEEIAEEFNAEALKVERAEATYQDNDPK